MEVLNTKFKLTIPLWKKGRKEVGQDEKAG